LNGWGIHIEKFDMQSRKGTMKRISAATLITVVHFLFTKMVTAAALHLSAETVMTVQKPLFEKILIGASKVLYFPLISMALYPRSLFPGSYIQIPILVNSLLWGVCLVLIWVLVRSKR